MQSADNSATRHDLPVSQQTMAAILLIVMLLSPILVAFTAFIDGFRLVIYAPTWILVIGTWPYFLISPLVLLSNFAFYGLKIIFVYFVHKSYSAEKTKKTTIRIGILSELVPFLFMMAPGLIMALFYPYGASIPFVVPVPIVLLLGYLVLRTWPPPATPAWIESDNEQMWWDKAETEETTEPEQEDVWP